jgi:hypothetical protein
MAYSGAPTLMAWLSMPTAADARNQLIDLNDQAVAATRRGDEPFLRG